MTVVVATTLPVEPVISIVAPSSPVPENTGRLSVAVDPFAGVSTTIGATGFTASSIVACVVLVVLNAPSTAVPLRTVRIGKVPASAFSGVLTLMFQRISDASGRFQVVVVVAKS